MWANDDVCNDDSRENKKHDQNTFTWTNGDIYKGDWRDNKRHGRGTITLANGDIYEGDWRNDNIHGRGTYTWASGDIYEGDWRDDHKRGQGALTLVKNGDVYEGEWRNNKLVDGDREWLDDLLRHRLETGMTRREFARMFASRGSKATASEVNAIFHDFDADASGFLESAELLRMEQHKGYGGTLVCVSMVVAGVFLLACVTLRTERDVMAERVCSAFFELRVFQLKMLVRQLGMRHAPSHETRTAWQDAITSTHSTKAINVETLVIAFFTSPSIYFRAWREVQEVLYPRSEESVFLFSILRDKHKYYQSKCYSMDFLYQLDRLRVDLVKWLEFRCLRLYLRNAPLTLTLNHFDSNTWGREILDDLCEYLSWVRYHMPKFPVRAEWRCLRNAFLKFKFKFAWPFRSSIVAFRARASTIRLRSGVSALRSNALCTDRRRGCFVALLAQVRQCLEVRVAFAKFVRMWKVRSFVHTRRAVAAAFRRLAEGDTEQALRHAAAAHVARRGFRRLRNWYKAERAHSRKLARKEETRQTQTKEQQLKILRKRNKLTSKTEASERAKNEKEHKKREKKRLNEEFRCALRTRAEEEAIRVQFVEEQEERVAAVQASLQSLALRRETELIDLNGHLSNTESGIVVVDAESVMDENEATLIVPIGDVILEERIQVVVGEWVD